MTTPFTPAAPRPPKSGLIPPLQNGDRLTRAEFERRVKRILSTADEAAP